ncbi:MAG TPA: RNA-directed DNA polymerase, partial [Candidatus Nanoarchaeia archaeon]|nr:RNA-directed DNA polymerase [Candidatus Nanoarchaeia archaeon]
KGKGMPLGNLTSQFFANVYLNELDQFIKHKLKAKYYVRYVDDFLILDSNKGTLKRHILEINVFLADKLSLQLHHEKTRIIRLEQGVPMLGFRIFQYHKLIQVRNIRKFRKKLAEMLKDFNNQETEYDAFYDFVEGWIAYSKHANTHNLSIRLLEPAKETMLANLSTKEINRFERNQRANSHLP